MRFKVLLFSASLLCTAALFTYCSKEAPAPETPTVSTDDEASSRGLCKVNIAAANGCLDICGTQTTPTICGVSSGGVNLVGTATIPMGGNQTFLLTTPTSLLISRNPSCVSSVFVTATVTTNAGVQVYNVPLAGTVQVNVGDLCNLF